MDATTDAAADIDLLEDVLAKTGDLVSGVDAGQAQAPTPCPDYDVGALVDHVVGWARAFAAGAQGREHEGDPRSYRAGADPAAEFGAAAGDIVAGWRDQGVDRSVTVSGAGEVPGAMVLRMTLMEYLTHGWDLAVSTGQPVPYTDDEAEAALAAARATLQPQYRGEGMPFGDIVPVPDDAPAIDRAVAFLGRSPRPDLG
jgi:uncharacterized protein (TIGR03086 family)